MTSFLLPSLGRYRHACLRFLILSKANDSSSTGFCTSYRACTCVNSGRNTKHLLCLPPPINPMGFSTVQPPFLVCSAFFLQRQTVVARSAERDINIDTAAESRLVPFLHTSTTDTTVNLSLLSSSFGRYKSGRYTFFMFELWIYGSAFRRARAVATRTSFILPLPHE